LSGRVLLVLGRARGGMLGHVLTLAEHLTDLGWRPTLAAPASAVRSAAVPLSGSTMPGPGMLADHRAIRRAAAHVDVIHAHGLTMGWVCASIRTRPPLIVTVHNVVLADRKPHAVWRVLERRLPRAVDRTIATAPDIARRLDGLSIVTIPPARPKGGVPTEDPAAVRRRYGITADASLIVAVGRLHPQKDIDTLLAATAELHARVPPVHVLVVGEGPDERRLRAEVSRRGLDGMVTFAGWSDEPANEMAAADVVAVSSRWESGPFVVPEALALGIPVVSTAVGWAPMLLEPGYVVPPEDPRALADAIQTVLADRARAGEGARAAAGRADRFLDPYRLTAEVVAVYEEVVRH